VGTSVFLYTDVPAVTYTAVTLVLWFVTFGAENLPFFPRVFSIIAVVTYFDNIVVVVAAAAVAVSS
jgi:hypothetical protein